MRNLPLFWARSQTLILWLIPGLRRFSSSASGGGGGGGADVAVKKVTRSNFEPALEDLRALVREADFVAVDLEMTGVTSAPWRDSFEFDRSDVRYLKLKDSAEKFAVVQFGVCPFRWEPSRGSFVAYPHNFYVFPRKELPVHGPSYEFLCQTTSIDFLAKYQFDFNTCIREGISYLSRAQEAEALKYLSSKYLDGLANSFCNLEEHVDIPLVRTADLFFSERMKTKFQEWRDAILKGSDKGCVNKENADSNEMQFQTVFFKMRPAVFLNGFSSHQLNLIQLVVRKHFKDLVYVCVVDEDNSWQRRVVYVETEEDKASFMKEVQQDVIRVEKRVESAVGFRHVVDLLASDGKLIVGHNCLLDLAHIYSKFFGPLPSSMMEFILAVHEKFPYIIDTKHLLNSSQVIQFLMKRSSKSLSSAFSLLCPKVSSVSQNSTSSTYVRFEIQADETGSSCFNSGAKHEAGYDAFMTGCVFAQACSHLGIKFEVHTPLYDLARNGKIKNYINVLYPSWNSGTVLHLNTGTESPESGYKRKYPAVIFANIVLIWGFPSKFKPKDLKDCICRVFGPDSITSIFFIDRTAALIQFSKEEFVNEILVLKDTLERVNDPISMLHPLSKLLEGGNTRAANYDTYRDICAASASKVLFADQADSLGIQAETASRRMKKLGIWLVKAADTWCSPYPKELVYRFGRILPLGGKRAKISDNAFIAPNAVVVGEVSVGRKATIGYNAIVRGDTGPVSIGESSCINDKAVVHGPSNIGKWTTIDPLAIIDNADVASCSMVGAASIVMPGARIESNCMLCSASVLRAGAVMPSGEIWSGNPAEKLGTLTEEERGYIIKAAKHMVLLNIEHTATWELTWEEIDNFRIGREHWANWAEHMIEARVKPFYTRAGPRNSGRKHKSPIEIMQGRLDGFGFEGVNETKNKGSDY